jgi:hypothetical protein
MRDDADKAQRSIPCIPIPVKFVGWDIERNARSHLYLTLRPVRHTLSLQDENLMLLGMLVEIKNSPRLKFDHSHSKVGCPFRLADHPPNRFVLSNRLLENLSIIST